MSFAAVLQRLEKLENPYPGLRPFDTSEAHLFFGRDQQISELIARLERNRFVAVVGVSGSGKSSLVSAGLIPALQHGRVTDSSARWRIVVGRPAGAPFANLAGKLSEAGLDPAPLPQSSYGLIHVAQQLPPDESLLLVVDQFEELFRYKDLQAVTEESRRQHEQAAAEAYEFVQVLLAGSRYQPPVYVVITMRSDYLGHCAEFRDFPEALNECQYLIPRLTRDQRRLAIECPLGATQISPALVQRMLNDAGDEPNQLPILQHALMRTWSQWRKSDPEQKRKIELQDYEDAGGFQNALDKHADAVWNALDADTHRDLAKRIFQRLTEKVQAGREVRRPSTVRELASVAQVSADEVKSVVGHYREEGCNFLTSPDRELTEDSVIDISHESLIRGWKELKDWIEEEANWGGWYRRLEDRKWLNSAYLVEPELDLALQARQHGRWNEAWAQRYVSSSLTYNDVVDFLEESSQARHSGLESYFGQMISSLVPEAELKHLFNLREGATKGYSGRLTLQSELRHLASSGLLMRKQGRAIAEMKPGTTFDLAEYIELTDLGRFLLNFAEQEGSGKLASAVILAEGYLAPIDLREAEARAARIRQTFKNARTLFRLQDAEPYLRHTIAAHRVVGYLVCQVVAEKEDVCSWAPELAGCLAREQTEALDNRETRPLWQLLVCITHVLRLPALSGTSRDDLRNALGDMQNFLLANPHLDPEGQCKSRIGELMKPPGELVAHWARKHGAANPWDMGPKNWERCLFDLGLPGGKLNELIMENGKLKYR